VIAERGSLKFSELFENAASRSEVICTFLALLELIRLKQLACAQPEDFSEIEIRRAENAVPVIASPVVPAENLDSISQVKNPE
jgi:segregation and condensation protein A